MAAFEFPSLPPCSHADPSLALHRCFVKFIACSFQVGAALPGAPPPPQHTPCTTTTTTTQARAHSHTDACLCAQMRHPPPPPSFITHPPAPSSRFCRSSARQTAASSPVDAPQPRTCSPTIAAEWFPGSHATSVPLPSSVPPPPLPFAPPCFFVLLLAGWVASLQFRGFLDSSSWVQ